MNRIVLIGNGFDLAHGLPTRYEDFINDYWKSFINDGVDHCGVCKKDCIKLDLKVSNYTIKEIFFPPFPQNHTELQNKILDYNKNRIFNREDRIELIIENKFFEFISRKSSFVNWVDIENEFYKFLSYQFDIKKYIDYNYENIDKLNNDFGYVKHRLSEYLIKLLENIKIEISEKISDLIYSPFFIGDFAENVKNEIINREIRKIYNSRSSTHDSSVGNISSKTIPLLKQIPDIDSIFLKIKSNDRTFWDKYFDILPDDIMFLNFNYTDLEKPYIDLHKPVNNKFIPMDIHIHGELNNPNNPIIFGYGDEIEENYRKLENLNDNAYLENIKSVKYLETDNYKRMLNFINSDKYQVIILGHSCGNSDRTLLNTLFEHENCVSIKPYYFQYKDVKTGETKDNYSDIVRNISRSFTDKKSMRDKVVNKTYTDWFSQKLD